MSPTSSVYLLSACTCVFLFLAYDQNKIVKQEFSARVQTSAKQIDSRHLKRL